MARRDVKIIEQAARKHGIPASVLWGVYGAESNFGKNKNNSPKGAQGPFQFMPDTARAYGINPRDFKQAANAAAKYLATYKGRGLPGMLAAYNAGPAAKNAATAYPETRNYITKVRQYAKDYPGQGSGGGGGKNTSERGGGGAISVSLGGRQQTPIPQSAGTGLADALQARLAPPSPPPSMGLQDPVFSARGKVPMASGVPQISSGPPPPKVSLTEQIAQVRKLQAGTDPLPKVEAEGSSSVVVSGGGSGSGSVKGGSGKTRPLLETAVAVSKKKLPYKWGGGHGPKPAPIGTPVDCSGYVSQILGVTPRTSGQFMTYGKPGRGKEVTLYTNQGHILIEINGRFFGTSKSNPGGGAGEIPRPSKAYLSKFVKRHPPGM